jgi:tetratricopeptide (TPR) repeat protein
MSQMVMLLLLQTILSMPADKNIKIINGGPLRPSLDMSFDFGPVVGDMLNAHFLPAVNWYNGGSYSLAINDFNYVIKRVHYFDSNPRQAEIMSVALYLRGMIYLYHAEGVGRHANAKADFEEAIKWNPQNYIAYLELSRVYSQLEFTGPATTILQRLLDLKPGEAIAKAAEDEMAKLKSKGGH